MGAERYRVSGPPGFCVDPSATREEDATAFALLGNCAAIGRGTTRQPDLQAVLTVTFSQPAPGMLPVSESVEEFDRFFRSAAGQRSLARSGDPASARMAESFFRNGVFYLRVVEGESGLAPGLAAEHWRGFFDLPGAIVSITATPREGSAADPAEVLALLRRFAQRLRQVNGVEVDRAVLTEVGLLTTPDVDSQPAALYERDIAQGPAGAGVGQHTATALRTIWAVGLIRRLIR